MNKSFTAWLIELRAPLMTEPLRVAIEDKVILGRHDVTEEQNPDIDFSEHGAETLGVSRRHAMLTSEQNQLMLTDLQSGNGTFLNGARLEAGKAYRVKHGDQIQMGRMAIEVHILVAPTASGFGREFEPQHAGNTPAQGEGQLIMIVEDHVEIARMFALILERNGFKTFHCRDVLSAIRMFNQKRPAAIILDLLLPDVHGLEFCRYVRRDVQRNTVPIVIVSAIKNPENEKAAKQAGANLFLGKPISATDLLGAVGSVLNPSDNKATMHTKHLPGTAPLMALEPESRSNTVVIFVAGSTDLPITLSVRQPITFGRGLSPLGLKAHVDLSKYDADNNGVSRSHMSLIRRPEGFFVEDLNSSNGTFVNGEPLQPHQLHKLTNADEVRLGQLRMYLYFLMDSGELPPR